MKQKLVIAGSILGILVLSGCGGSTAAPGPNNANPAAGPQTAATNDANSASQQNAAPTAVSGDSAQGKEIFSQSCIGCHSTGSDQIVGPGMKGETAKEKLANGKPMNDQNLKDWIKAGGTGKIGNMPGMGGTLSDQQINDVIAYVKTLK